MYTPTTPTTSFNPATATAPSVSSSSSSSSVSMVNGHFSTAATAATAASATDGNINSTHNKTVFMTNIRDSSFSASSSSSRASVFLGRCVRTLLLDLPLTVVLLTLASVLWLDHVHTHYLSRQMTNLAWTADRTMLENTYYYRQCDKTDLSTNTSTDLFLEPDATAADAAAHQLKHGFTVVPNVISDATMTGLRDLIHAKNYAEESMYVIEGTHRFSIMFGTEDKIVRDALEEISNHQQFREALEAMVGPDPAMIELTAISSSAGAVAQWWHSDVDDQGSATNFAKAFGPSYSVFINLQNTTRAMGATSLCPGSHYCTDGPISAFCEEAGIHVVNKDGYTKGDALIMNMNSYHRGGAHVDYGGLDRVMLILTFSPKPRTQAESRQMSQGITFQQRWDMWGHTLNDLANANTVMVQPWVILRSLGLYKLPGTAWGIDYITSSAQRIVSVDNGFRRFDLVDGLLATGGFPFLPPFLHAKISKTDSWYEFLSATLELCVDFMKSVSMGAVGLYVLSTLILCIPMKQRVSFFRNAMIRMLIIIGITALLFTMAKKYSDESDWAKDHAAERKFTSLVKYERMAVKNACSDNIKGRVMFCSNTKKRPTTFPHQTDFLIETRLGSESFAAFNNFIDGHPGNIVVRTAIQSASIAATFNDYSLFFKNAVARYISGLIFSGRGRFLYQKPDGAWVRLSESEADAFTKQELWFQTNKVAKFATNWIRMIGSDFRFGVYRDTSMAIHHSRRFMQDLEQKILKRMHSSIGLETTSSTPDAEPTQNRSRLFKLPPSPSTRREALVPHPGALRSRDLSPQPTEPRPGAWLEQGDVVEAMTEVDEKGWYGAKILRVSSDGRYTLQFGDGTFESVDLYKVRNVQPFAVDEKIDVMLDDQEYHEYEVVEMNPDGTVNAKSLESEEIMEDIPPLHMMRTGGYTPRKPDRNSPVYGLAVGALVEVKSETEEDLWYTGSITSISTDGDYVYKIDFVDGASQSVSDSRTIRPVSEYRPGEILMVDRDEEYKFMAKLSYGSFQAMHIATGEVVDGFTAQDVGRTGRFSL